MDIKEEIVKRLRTQPRVYNERLCKGNSSLMIEAFRQAKMLEDLGIIGIRYNGRNYFVKGPRYPVAEK